MQTSDNKFTQKVLLKISVLRLIPVNTIQGRVTTYTSVGSLAK